MFRSSSLERDPDDESQPVPLDDMSQSPGRSGRLYSHMWDITAAMEVPASFFFEGLARALNDAA